MKKKLFALILSALLLAGCTAGTSKKSKKKKSSSEEIVARVTSVTLDRSELNFNLSENEEDRFTTWQLIATVNGEGDYEKSVTWSSSDEEVVTVENGVANAIALGEATITAVSTFDKTKSATCSVSVVEGAPVVKEVKINPANPIIDLKEGKTIKLTAEVLGDNAPSQQVTWSAKSSGVLSVDQNGFVTATKTGTGTVTATSAKNTSVSNTVTVTVIDSTPIIESVEIQPTAARYELDIYKADKKTMKFTAKVNPNGVPETIEWKSSDSTKVSVDQEGLVTALATTGASDVTITATSTYKNPGETTYKSDSVKIGVIDSTPRVTSVTVELSTATLRMDKTAKATYSVSGYIEESQKTATWSSSNTNVAEIDENGNITPIGEGTVNIIATADFVNPDGKKMTGSKTLTVKKAEEVDDYTIMLYICGADLESSNQQGNGGNATEDISEILQAGKTPDGVNVIIETGGASEWKSSSKNLTKDGSKIPANLTRWVVNDSAKIEKVTDTYQPKDASMGLQSTFTSFLQWGLTNYPADKTAVIMWNHGGGMSGCCFDENNSDDGLTPTEMYNAFKDVLGSGSNATKLEWIGYDCCTMQMADIASINADYFHYQIASQELEASTGWVYSNWLEELYNGLNGNDPLTTEELLKVICDDFVNANSDWGSDNDQVLSYIKLDNMNAFTSAFNEFTKDCNTASYFNNVVNQSKNTLRFSEELVEDSFQYYICYGDVDMGGLLNNLNAPSTLTSAYNNIICYHKYYSQASKYSSKKPTGLNAFVAMQYDDDYVIQLTKSDYPTTSTKFTTWCNMNRDHWPQSQY